MESFVEVQQGSITDADADVLVNASNTSAWLGSGVSGAIRRACGPGFQASITAALTEQWGAEGLAPGAVMITDAGAHPRAQNVAHVAVMDYRPGHERDAAPDKGRIERGYRALWAALETIPRPALSVALPALGAGTGGIALRTTTEIACRTLLEHRGAQPGSRIARVIFFGYELHEFVNMVHVVRAHFALDESALDPEVLAFVQRLD